MPSVRTLLTSLLASSLLQYASAAPVATPVIDAEDCGLPIKVGTAPALPSISGMPTTNLTLQYVAIGRGIQNYTCSSAGATPVSDGAMATLYDATSLAYIDEDALNAIPPKIVYLTAPSTALKYTAYSFPVLGRHFFDAALTPTFDLYNVDKIMYGAKSADIKAPVGANAGPSGTGAVDWLQLTPKVGYTSVGMAMVYRVETAGGVAGACTEAGVMSVQYAAEYWFYD